MTSLSRPALEKAIEQGRLEPLYLLTGEETYLRDDAANRITKAALRDSLLGEFNQSSFNLLSQSAGDAVAAAEQLPMMSPLRVVRITAFNKLKEADEAVLISYLQRPCESSVVIFIADDLDKRRKLTKTLLDECVVVDFQPLKDGEAKKWASDRLKELKVSTTDRVLNEILDLVGTDIRTLDSELEKLALAAGGSGKITGELVDDLIGRSRELSNFDLGDHLLAHDRKRALQTLHRLLEQGAEPVMLVGAIGGSFRRLALAREALTRGGRDEVFRVTPMPFFRRDEYLRSLQRFDAHTIARNIKLIANADLGIKTSVATPRLQLEMLVFELTA